MATKIIRKSTTTSSTGSNHTKIASDLRPQIEIGVNRDGSLRVATPTVDLGYCGDNNVTGILFNLDDLANATGIELDRYRLSLICVHDLVSYKFDFDTDGFWVNKYITLFPGTWEFTVVIEEINPETETENVAAEVERFVSAAFKGKVKESNYDWTEIAHYDNTLPIFESSDLPSLYKNEIRLNTITTKLGATVAGYKNDRFMSYVTLPFGPDNSVWQSAKLFFYNGEEVIAYDMTATNEGVFGCWIAPRITEQSGIWEAIVLLTGEDKELCSNTFQVKVLNNASDRNAIDPNITPLTLLYDRNKEGLADKNAAKMRAIGATPTYNLKYSGEEVDGLLDAVNSGAVGTNTIKQTYVIPSLEGSEWMRLAKIEDPTQPASGHFKITTSATRVDVKEESVDEAVEVLAPGEYEVLTNELTLRQILQAQNKIELRNAEDGLVKEIELIEDFNIEHFPEWLENPNTYKVQYTHPDWSYNVSDYLIVYKFLLGNINGEAAFSSPFIGLYELGLDKVPAILANSACIECTNNSEKDIYLYSGDHDYFYLIAPHSSLSILLSDNGLNNICFYIKDENIEWDENEEYHLPLTVTRCFLLDMHNTYKTNLTLEEENNNPLYFNSPGWDKTLTAEVFHDVIIETPATLSYQEFKCGRLENGTPFFQPIINTGEVVSDANGSSDNSGSGEENYNLVNEELINLVSDVEVEAISDEGVEVTSDDGYSGSDVGSDSGSGSGGNAGWGFEQAMIYETPKDVFYINGFLHFNTTHNYKDITVDLAIQDAENILPLDEAIFDTQYVNTGSREQEPLLEGDIVPANTEITFQIQGNLQDYINAVDANKYINITYTPTTLEGEDLDPVTLLGVYEDGTTILDKIQYEPLWPYKILDLPEVGVNYSNTGLYIDLPEYWYKTGCFEHFHVTYTTLTWRVKLIGTDLSNFPLQTPLLVVPLFYGLSDNTRRLDPMGNPNDGKVIASLSEDRTTVTIDITYYNTYFPISDEGQWFQCNYDWEGANDQDISITLELVPEQTNFILNLSTTYQTPVVFDRYNIQHNNFYNFSLWAKKEIYNWCYESWQIIDVKNELESNAASIGSLQNRTNMLYDDLFNLSGIVEDNQIDPLPNDGAGINLYETEDGDPDFSKLYFIYRDHSHSIKTNIWVFIDWGTENLPGHLKWTNETLKLYILDDWYVDIDLKGRVTHFNRPEKYHNSHIEYWIPYENTSAFVLQKLLGRIILQYKNPIICELETSIKNQLGDIESILDILNGEAQ